MNTKVKTCEKFGLCTHENMEALGAWVYTGLCVNSIFQRYDSIREAVIEAVKHDNSHVIFNGIDVKFGMITEGVAYYMCVNTDKVIIIDLTGAKSE